MQWFTHSPNKQKLPGMILGGDANSFGVVTGSASAVKTLQNQICRKSEERLVTASKNMLYFTHISDIQLLD